MKSHRNSWHLPVVILKVGFPWTFLWLNMTSPLVVSHHSHTPKVLFMWQNVNAGQFSFNKVATVSYTCRSWTLILTWQIHKFDINKNTHKNVSCAACGADDLHVVHIHQDQYTCFISDYTPRATNVRFVIQMSVTCHDMALYMYVPGWIKQL